MNMKKLIPVLVGIVLVGAGIWYVVDRNRTETTSEQNQVETTATPTPVGDVVSYQGQESKTALAILKEQYTVETQSFDFGEMVKSINGKDAGTTHYWAFKVNGEDSMVGAGDYVTKDADQIEWVFTAL